MVTFNIVLDIETIKETLKEIICSGHFAADVEDILREELRDAGFSEKDVSSVIRFAKKYFASCGDKEEWIDAYAKDLCQDPFGFLCSIKKSPKAVLRRLRFAVVLGILGR